MHAWRPWCRGQINPFAIPTLAKMRGIQGWVCDKANKRTNICPGPPPEPSLAAGAGTGPAGISANSTAAGAAPPGPGQWCVYCGARNHLMMGCPAFQRMLQAVFAAGAASAAPQQRTAPPPASTAARALPANDWSSLAQRAIASVQQAGSGYEAAAPATSASPPAQRSTATAAATVQQGISSADSAALCLLCHTRPSSGILIPCGHHAVCASCGAQMMEGGEAAPAAACPVCQAEVGCLARLPPLWLGPCKGGATQHCRASCRWSSFYEEVAQWPISLRPVAHTTFRCSSREQNATAKRAARRAPAALSAAEIGRLSLAGCPLCYMQHVFNPHSVSVHLQSSPLLAHSATSSRCCCCCCIPELQRCTVSLGLGICRFYSAVVGRPRASLQQVARGR